MIEAIIHYQDSTLIMDLPRNIYDIHEKLRISVSVIFIMPVCRKHLRMQNWIWRRDSSRQQVVSGQSAHQGLKGRRERSYSIW